MVSRAGKSTNSQYLAFQTNDEKGFSVQSKVAQMIGSAKNSLTDQIDEETDSDASSTKSR